MKKVFFQRKYDFNNVGNVAHPRLKQRFAIKEVACALGVCPPRPFLSSPREICQTWGWGQRWQTPWGWAGQCGSGAGSEGGWEEDKQRAMRVTGQVSSSSTGLLPYEADEILHILLFSSTLGFLLFCVIYCLTVRLHHSVVSSKSLIAAAYECLFQAIYLFSRSFYCYWSCICVC